MADISNEDLRKEIAAILKDADLTSLSSKKVRQQLEEKLDTDLTDRKKEVDDLVMECLHNKQDGKGKPNKKSKDDEDEDEDKEEEDEEEEDEEEEEEKPKAKRAKKPAKRPKKGSSDESEEGSDDDASDEEYSPSKKGKSAPKKGKPARKKKGSDSDSDEDWAKSRKSSSGGGGGGGGGAKRGGGGGKRGGGGYTRPQTLSPELAALMGQESMPRHEVVRKIWTIIKERNLYDPKNKQFAICDNEMLKIFGVKRFRTFGMMKYLKNHFVE